MTAKEMIKAYGAFVWVLKRIPPGVKYAVLLTDEDTREEPAAFNIYPETEEMIIQLKYDLQMGDSKRKKLADGLHLYLVTEDD